MKYQNIYVGKIVLTIAFISILFSSCKKDGNPNNLPEVNPSDFAGKIDGFGSTDEIYASNLIAYWSFDGTNNELKSNTAPTSAANNTFKPAGIRGQALSLNAGYLYYGKQFDAFKTTNFKSFTISTWVQILNNGNKSTMLFQIARPGMFNGNVDFVLETQANPASKTDYLQIHPYFLTIGGGRQDNINNYGDKNVSPAIGADKWVNLVVTYDGGTGTFNIFGNGSKIGNYPNRGTGSSLFNSFEPSEIIIGGNYNVIPGKLVNADTGYAAMTGSIDEIRIYDRVLPEAIIKTVYNLGLVGK